MLDPQRSLLVEGTYALFWKNEKTKFRDPA
jgi:hypothetical protein